MHVEQANQNHIRQSVIAVPPLARCKDLAIDKEQNQQLIRHIESGGVRTLLYGGNANFYHIALSEYANVLEMISESLADDTWVIPSVGPAYGTMMDQARILREHAFPTAMILPQQGITTNDGVETGVRHFVEAYGRPTVLYIKHDGFISVDGVKRLADDGLLSWVKYAVVRKDPSNDPFLRELVDQVDPNIIVSGIGEQPAIVHMRDFGVGCFTSGCVCIAPRLSMNMLASIRAGEFVEAERIRAVFKPLEDLRNAINPIRVLHEAVALSGIADTGHVLPLLSNLHVSDHDAVREAAINLLTKNSVTCE